MPGEGAVLLFWPAVSVVGFLLLAALIVVLGAASTAQYEFERNRVQRAQQQVSARAGSGDVAPGGIALGDSARGPAGGDRAEMPDARSDRGAAVSVAHPAGKRVREPGSVPAWWLVDERDDQPGAILAGPFPDWIDADWAALAGGLPTATRVVHGVPRADGAGLVQRQSPHTRAWLSELGDQLDRLPKDWDALLSDEDALTTLVVEVASALVEAGLTLHDCSGGGSAGGVCLTPGAGHQGIVISWHRHDRMSLQQVRGDEMDEAVQRTMNAAIADILSFAGFAVQPFGSSGCSFLPADG